MLKNEAVTITPDVTWYYEDKSGIEIYHWTKDSNGKKVVHQIKIPWRKLRASVERKYGKEKASK